MWKTPPIDDLTDALAEASNPVGMRMRAAYFLRHLHEQAKDNKSRQQEIVNVLAGAAKDLKMGSLMRHELCYVMGQIRDDKCCEPLEDILEDDNDCVMVRHEAAEALGAIGAERSRPALESVMTKNPGRPELSDTCRLALDFMQWRRDGGDAIDAPAACACMLNPYSSVDPAPPHPAHESKTTAQLGDILCNTSEPIFERYRAMFSLRNRGGKAAVSQLCRALVEDESSALLRHEVAYVLGQMQHSASVEALEESLRRKGEHEMVRHESAEALGTIDGRWDEVEAILQEFSNDANTVVRESCLVALDAADYWSQNDKADSDGCEVESSLLTFTQEKIATASMNSAPTRILVNHFNVCNK